MSNDALRNLLSGLALIISLFALLLSGLTFLYQYVDRTTASVSVTGFELQGKMMNNGLNQDKVITVTTRDINVGLVVSIFNSGNRVISVNEIKVYLQPGDFETLSHVSPTPPYTSQVGSKLLFDGQGAKLTSEAKVIDAQHIFSAPLDFPMFSPPDTIGVLEQGTVCLNILAYSYEGKSASISYPIGLVSAIQGNFPPPTGFRYMEPRGSKLGDMHRLF